MTVAFFDSGKRQNQPCVEGVRLKILNARTQRWDLPARDTKDTFATLSCRVEVESATDRRRLVSRFR